MTTVQQELAGGVVLAVGGLLFAFAAYERVDRPADSFGSRDRGEWRVVRELASNNALAAAALLAAAFATRPPFDWLGLHAAAFTPRLLAVGVGFGVALYALTELLIAAVAHLDLHYAEDGRTSTAPDSRVAWAAFLGVTLPVVSLSEELLYRGVFVGVAAAVLPVGVWTAATVSTLAFAGIHNTGAGGVLIAGVLGACTAAAFVATASLLVVVAAHTCVNALEYGVHEGLGVDPVRALKPAD